MDSDFCATSFVIVQRRTTPKSELTAIGLGNVEEVYSDDVKTWLGFVPWVHAGTLKDCDRVS